MLDPNHLMPAHDETPVADPDRAMTALSDGLHASRDLMRGTRTLLALAHCPGPALHDPIDD